MRDEGGRRRAAAGLSSSGCRLANTGAKIPPQRRGDIRVIHPICVICGRPITERRMEVVGRPGVWDGVWVQAELTPDSVACNLSTP